MKVAIKMQEKGHETDEIKCQHSDRAEGWSDEGRQTKTEQSKDSGDRGQEIGRN